MSALCLRLVQAAVASLSAVALLIIPLPLFCAADPTPISSSIQRRTLPSGMQVIVLEQAGAPLAALDLRIRVGSGAETAETNGTAHFIEHLVFKGTDTRKRGEIDQAVEELGGELKAQTTRDATRFSTVLPAAKWKEALAAMVEMTQHPVFRSEDVATEKPVILSEMAIARTEPMRAGFNALVPLVFDAGDPYRFPVMGSEENIKAITPEALKTFWQKWYLPQNITLVIVGDVKAAEVFSEAERLFPGMPSATASESQNPASKSIVGSLVPSVPRTTISEAGGGNLTTVFLGFRAPASSESDAALAVSGLVSLLAERVDQGSGEGMLTDALITQQRLAFSVTADYVAQRRTGLVMLSVTGKRGSAAKLEDALLNELKKRIATGFTASDAAQARRNLLQAQSPSGSIEAVAARLAMNDILSLSPEETDDLALYTAHLEKAVTPESLTAAAKEYLSPDRRAVVVIRPSDLATP
jgi:zinc protease